MVLMSVIDGQWVMDKSIRQQVLNDSISTLDNNYNHLRTAYVHALQVADKVMKQFPLIGATLAVLASCRLRCVWPHTCCSNTIYEPKDYSVIWRI